MIQNICETGSMSIKQGDCSDWAGKPQTWPRTPDFVINVYSLLRITILLLNVDDIVVETMLKGGVPAP